MKKRSISHLRQLGKKKKDEGLAAPVDPLIEAEEKDIQRLERLLGISKSKDKRAIVNRLNKEYEEEGIGADFGSFLMDLDDIIGMGPSKDLSEEEDEFMIDDFPDRAEKQEKKKAKASKQDNENSVQDIAEKQQKNKLTSKAEANEKLPPKSKESKEITVSTATYVPPSKRLITGDSKSVSTITQNVAKVSETKQEKAIKKLQRCINGIVNKLTEETKDRTLQDLNELYELNDQQLVTNLLLECVFSHVLANDLKVSFQLPLFTTFLTAVHALVGESMATATVHKVFDKFLSVVEDGKDLDWNKQSHNALLVIVYLTMLNVIDLSLVVDLVQYFLRPQEFKASVPAQFQDHRFFRAMDGLPEMLRMEYADMILCRVGERIRREDPATLQSFVAFFQQQLRVQKAARGTSGSYTRIQFLFESLADFDCKRMQRVRDKHFEEIKEYRKWLSQHVQRQYRSLIMQRQQEDNKRRERDYGANAIVPKNILAFIGGTNAYASHNERIFASANIVVPDKNMDVATASAILQESAIGSTEDQDDESARKAKPITTAMVVEQIVEKKGQQLRLNTPNRKAIFGVLMTCRDLEDAHEKIIGLHLGATMDRDLVRVLLECAGKEWPYNPFYGELLKLFCTTMPSCKLTAEIAFYDEIATIITQDEEMQAEERAPNSKQRVKIERRVLNHARLLADLLMQFKLTLAVLRKIDISLISEGSSHSLLLMFLSTLFVTMFTYESPSASGNGKASSSSVGSQTSDEEQQQAALLLSVCDRLGRSKHYEVVRMFILQFLEEHMKKLPSSIPKDSPLAVCVKKGRKIMLKSMRDMEILHQYTTADTAIPSSDRDQEEGGFGSAQEFDRIEGKGRKNSSGKKNKHGKSRNQASGWDAAIDFD